MRLRDHLEVISNPVCLEVLDGEKVLYRGYKGCLEYQLDKDTYLDRKVKHFEIRVEARGRREPQDAKRFVVTELNCGKFYYKDLSEALIYSYELENK